MSKNVTGKTSVRQLPIGQMENIRKKFENASDISTSKPPVSPKKIPRPVSAAISSPNREPNVARNRPEHVHDRNSNFCAKKGLVQPKPENTTSDASSEFHNLREQILQKANRDSCPVSKHVQNFDENSQNGVTLRAVRSEQDFSGVSRSSPARPISVAERTKMFEKRSSIEEDSVMNLSNVSGSPSKVRLRVTTDSETNQRDFKPTPTARPRSRPPSSEIDAKDLKPTPPIKPRSRPPSQAIDDNDNAAANEYGLVWDCGVRSSGTPNAPPMKPPRTGAHDDYMKLKFMKEQEKEKENVESEHQYESVSNGDNNPVYRRINKNDSFGNSDATKRPLKPNRPPPPRDRPGSVPKKSNSFNSKDRPLPKRPGEPGIHDNVSPLYEELNSKFDLANIKHWDLPQDELPPSGSLVRSYSAECLSRDSMLNDPVYVDPLKVNFRDDTDFDVYVDPSGYAIPYRHKRLQQTASTPLVSTFVCVSMVSYFMYNTCTLSGNIIIR